MKRIFSDKPLVPAARHLAETGKQVIIAGLDLDYLGRPFPPMPDLLALADSISKMAAICMRCGAPAQHTQRLVESRNLFSSEPSIRTRRAADAASSLVSRGRRYLISRCRTKVTFLLRIET